MLRKPIKEMTTYEKAELASCILATEESVARVASKVDQLLEKIEEDAMTLAVIGQFKRGKSALSNRILGTEILPVGIVPVTGVATKVRYGKPKSQVLFQNGVCEDVEKDELTRYISEQENKSNERGVSEVSIQTESPFLKSGILFVDTPGVGSFHQNNTEVAYDSIKESDGVIFLLSVDSPINQIEIDFLKRVKEFAAKFFFVVNKVDLVSEAELRAYMDYCSMILRQLMYDPQNQEEAEATPEIRIFPVSAKTGAGIEALKESIVSEIAKNRHAIMEDSMKKKLVDLTDVALKQLNFYWKAMNMEPAELDKHFAAIQKKSEEIRAEALGIEGNFMQHLNDFKLTLSETVEAEFGMDYYYEIDLVKLEMLGMKREEFLHQTEGLLSDLQDTLNRILLYREENAYTVCHRINAINRLTRELRRIRDSLRD